MATKKKVKNYYTHELKKLNMVGNGALTVCLPIVHCRELGLENLSWVIVERTKNGFLITKA
jgi:hypothetical protein